MLQPSPTRRTQAERRAATTAALIAAARELFAVNGYAATDRDAIAARAGVTYGAIYHHFSSKADLFAAVVEQLDRELADRATEASRGARSAVGAIRRGVGAYLDALSEPGAARIAADVPSVLGVEAYRTISNGACLPLISEGIRAARREGADVPGDPPVVAAMLLGALNEAALLIADGHHDAGKVKRSALRFVDRVVGA